MVSDTSRCLARESISTGAVMSSGLCGSLGTARSRLLPPGGVVAAEVGGPPAPPSPPMEGLSVKGPGTAAGPK